MTSIPISEELPSAHVWRQAQREEVLDADGIGHTLEALIGHNGDKVVLIFVRHFWCGICQHYIKHLSITYPASRQPPPPGIIFIGCGSASALPAYIKVTESTFPIYTNPSLSLYNLFGFISNLDAKNLADNKKGYMQGKGLVGVTWDAMRKGPFSGWGKGLGDYGRTGPYAQNGGELIIEDGIPTFVHRMINSSDHLDIPDLYRLLSFDEETIAPAGGGHGREKGSSGDGSEIFACESGVKIANTREVDKMCCAFPKRCNR